MEKGVSLCNQHFTQVDGSKESFIATLFCTFQVFIDPWHHLKECWYCGSEKTQKYVTKIIESRLSLIVQVNVVLNRTVVVDSENNRAAKGSRLCYWPTI